MLVTTCSYIPLEIALSCGLPAKRLFLTEKTGLCTESYLPRDFCAYARGFLGSLQSAGGEERAVFLAVAGSCDAMRRVADVARIYRQELQVHFVDLPRSCDDHSVDYYAAVLREFRKEICGGKGNNIEPLRQAILTMNAFRRAVRRRLDEARRSANERSWTQALEFLVNASELLASGTFSEAQIDRGEGFAAATSDGGPEVVLTGTMCLDTTVVSAIEEAGLKIRAVDSCLGERALAFEVDATDPDPFQALARAYLRKIPCPRMLDPRMREERLRRLFYGTPGDGGDAPDGIIYFVPKFCDQGYYDYAEVRYRAAEAGLPVLLLEGEPGAGKTAQVKTRLVAFREMLEMRRSRTCIPARGPSGKGRS